MERSLVKTVARQAGWRVVGLATAMVLLASWSFGQTVAPEKKPAEGQKPSAAEQQKLPKADELLGKMVDALGGEAALKKVTTRVSKGTFEQGPIKADITIYEAAPNKSLQIIEMPGGQKIEEGRSGEVFWRQTPAGPQRLQGEEAALAERHSDFYFPLNWRQTYKSAETTGTEMIDGRPAYKILMTPKEGPPETWYIGEKTNLLERMDLALPGVGTIETYLEDYRKQDGLMLAFKVRQLLGGQQVAAVTLSSVEQNVDIPKERFEPPAEIKDAGQEKKGPARPGEPKPDKPEKPDKPAKP